MMKESSWMWEVDKDGVYTYVDPQIEDILGYSSEEVLGKTPFDMMSPEESVSITNSFNDIVGKREPIVALKNVNLHKNGGSVILETNGVPLFDDTGNLTHYRGFDLNVTDKIRRQKEAREGREKIIKMLQDALENVKVLNGVLPICPDCYKIKDNEGYWNLFEAFIEKHTHAKFSFCECPECKNKRSSMSTDKAL